MSLRALDELGNEHVEFRRTLAAIVEQFGDDPHWENFMARALAYHADGHFDRAVEFYNRAVQCIRNDSNVAALPSWREIICDIELLRDRGLRRERHDGTT
jgi:hypothetical protein